ncbi:synaptonemal complex 1-like protein [Labeo rohita]|uniref:Synaptonemal complex 1-like protein n=1 Tax=Labeo rohita TaxID=84645 RepID=A0A498LL93_LABRO|nr:synaptonemal complex 1-like protein [Labeo rohita]
MQKPFNFKLLVPPRAHLNQVSAVKPQETGLFEENSVLFPSNQSYNKCTDIETRLPFPSKMVLPTKTSRTEGMKKAAVMPMEKEETSLRSSQLYSRLLDEAEKIKLWKFKMDSEISQKDRKLQENRKTIETQRKAIQELQFANESLSMKLEDQLNENEDLRNKSNATRNLCNILKDTFERSAEKMNLFEAEREETHDLFIQNSENIQVAMLQEKLQEKENNLKDVLLKLKEAQQSCSIIEESERKHQKLLQSVTQDRDALEENLRVTEQLKREIEQTQRDLTYKLEQSKENHEKALQTKDSELQELNNMKEQQSKQLSEMQLTVNSLQFSLTSEIQSTILKSLVTLGYLYEEVIKGQKEDNNKQIQTLRNELDEKSNSLLSVKEELKTMEVQVFQLIASVEEKKNEASDLKDEMESVTTENNNMKEALSKARLDNEELQEVVALKEAKLKEVEEQLSGALESSCKSSQEVERLENDIKQQKEKYEELMLKFNDLQMQKDTIQQQGKSTKRELLIKDKQIKALESKLTNTKTKLETKTVAHEECLKEIIKLKEDSESIKKHHKEELQKLSSDLEDKSTSEAQLNLEVQKLKQTAMEALKSKDDTEIKCQQKISNMVALMERHKVTEIKPKKGRNKISKTQKADTTKKHVYELLYEDEYVPASRNASYIPASFRIRTPPTPEIKGSWKKDILKLDPKSDNSDSNDILSFSPRPVKSKRPMQPKEADTGSLDLFKKVQSSFPCKSPGTVLKLAAIKRMRDAGWTTVSNSDKKKKKVTDKIFA